MSFTLVNGAVQSGYSEGISHPSFALLVPTNLVVNPIISTSLWPVHFSLALPSSRLDYLDYNNILITVLTKSIWPLQTIYRIVFSEILMKGVSDHIFLLLWVHHFLGIASSQSLTETCMAWKAWPLSTQFSLIPLQQGGWASPSCFIRPYPLLSMSSHRLCSLPRIFCPAFFISGIPTHSLVLSDHKARAISLKRHSPDSLFSV